jgi:hypothetical protein
VGEGDGAADGIVGRSVLIETQQGFGGGARTLAPAGSGGVGGVHTLVGGGAGAGGGASAYIVGDDVAGVVPATEVAETVKGLMVVDPYGVRERLGAVVSTAGLDR